MKKEYTLSEWVTLWLDTYKRPLIRPSTYDSYVQYSSHIKCDTPLSELTSIDIQSLVTAMARDRKAFSTIKHMLTLCRQSLRKARALGLIDSVSCMDDIELPRSCARAVESLSADECSRVLEGVSGTYYGDFFAALLLTGCRVGELIALRWQDVDFFAGCIYIEHTDYNGGLQPVKTDAGRRRLPLTDQLRRILQGRGRMCRGERVFLNKSGKPIRYRSLLDSWHWYARRVGIRRCGLHVLRHSFAHRALRAGIPVRVVSAWLGHADVAITLSIYDTVTRDDMLAAADTLTEMYMQIKKA